MDNSRDSLLRRSTALRAFFAIGIVCWFFSILSSIFNWNGGRGRVSNWEALRRKTIPPDIAFFYARFPYFHTPHFFSPDLGPIFMYPASSSLPYEFLAQFGRYDSLAFFITGGVLVSIAGYLFAMSLVRRGNSRTTASAFVIATCVLSYPFSFEWARQNIEIYIWALLVLGVASVWRERWNAAAVWIGIAMSMKLYPFILLGMFFARKKFRAMLLAVATAVLVNFVSLWLLGGDIGYTNRQIIAGLAGFHDQMTTKPMSLGLDHSLFGLFKLIRFRPDTAVGGIYEAMFHWYMPAMVVGALLLYFLRIRLMPRTNQLVALLVCLVWLPPTSFDYTLMELYPAWAVLVLALLRPQRRGLTAAFVLLGILFSPQNFLIVRWYELAGGIKSLALLGLLTVSLLYPWPDDHRTPALETA